MKHFPLGLALVSILAFSACSKKVDEGVSVDGTGAAEAAREAGEAGLIPVVGSETPALATERSRQIARLEDQKRHALEALDPSDIQGRESLAAKFDASLEQLRKAPAHTTRDLKAMSKDSIIHNAAQSIGALIDHADRNAVKRIGPEPKPGEKRAMADDGGSCTNDFIVDLQAFNRQSAEASQKIARLLFAPENAHQALKVIAASLVKACDGIVDRYGATASCTLEDGTVKSMREFREGCIADRERMADFL